MNDKFVFLSPVTVYDDKIFTEARSKEWKEHIKKSYKEVFHELRDAIDSSSFVDFFLCKSLLDEVIVDAIIGMRKITDSKYNSVEDPNSFKIISYLSYWWLRHKPASLHYPADFCLDDVKIKRKKGLSDKEAEYERQKLIWRLKHINELVAVHMVFTYIFNFDNTLCETKTCKRIKKKEKEKFNFCSFEEMKEVMTKKLTYYFCYRTIAPKVIEHILEAYTFHPAWGLTGDQWATAKEESESP